jgi:hypothetical protein
LTHGFVQEFDNDRVDEVPHFQPLTGGASAEDQEEANTMGRDGEKDEPQTGRHGRGRPPKHRGKEVAADIPVELKQEKAPVQATFRISSLFSATRNTKNAELVPSICSGWHRRQRRWGAAAQIPVVGSSAEDVMKNKEEAKEMQIDEREEERWDESKTHRRGRGRPPKQESAVQQRRQEKALVEELVEQ